MNPLLLRIGSNRLFKVSDGIAWLAHCSIEQTDLCVRDCGFVVNLESAQQGLKRIVSFVSALIYLAERMPVCKVIGPHAYCLVGVFGGLVILLVPHIRSCEHIIRQVGLGDFLYKGLQFCFKLLRTPSPRVQNCKPEFRLRVIRRQFGCDGELTFRISQATLSFLDDPKIIVGLRVARSILKLAIESFFRKFMPFRIQVENPEVVPESGIIRCEARSRASSFYPIRMRPRSFPGFPVPSRILRPAGCRRLIRREYGSQAFSRSAPSSRERT